MSLQFRLTAAAVLSLLMVATVMLASAAIAQRTSTQAPPAVSAPATSAKPKPPAAKPTGKAEEIIWDDLMPAGEEARIEALYEAYFLDLERQMRSSQTQLTAPNRKRTQTIDPFAIAEGSALDEMPQIGTFNTVAELNNRKIRIPAYIVPLDFNSKDSYKEFLLAPYFGACIHTPPPPPNQIIYVKANPPAKIKDIWGAVWAEGILTTTRHENAVGSAAYTLQLIKIEPYE